MKSGFFSAVFGVLMASAAVQAMAADMPVIRYAQGQFAVGAGQLPYTIGVNKGFFDKEGIRVEQVKVTGANAAAFDQGYIPAIEHGGPADIASVPNGQFVQVVLNGSDGIAVASQNANPRYGLIVKPDIKSFADLKGKELTLTAPWDNITLSTRELLKKHGLKDTDYTFKSIAGTEGRMACLKKGDCSAVIVGEPADIDTIRDGNHRLGFANETGRYVYNVEVVTRAWAEKNKDTLVRYLKADADIMRFINDPKNRDEVSKTLTGLTHEPDDVVKEMVDNIENPKLRPWSRNAEFDMAGFRHVLQLVKDFKLTDKPLPPAERFVDLSYGKAAGIHE